MSNLFSVGMYGGSFDPLHLGHLRAIMIAASMCKELHIVLSYSKSRDTVPFKQRYQWLREATAELDNVVTHAIEDYDNSKEAYNWEAGAKDIKSAVKKHIDVVFCGSDYKDTNRFEQLYPNSTIVYINRDDISISSTDIKADPYKHWEYIPTFVRPYYTKKVLIVGSESTGKSTLAFKLARTFNTTYLHEIGRDICERAGQEEYMLDDDFYEIMVKHKSAEYEQTKQANKIIFIDTDVVTTLFYSKLLSKNREVLESYKEIASGMASLNRYDLILFLEQEETEFIQDGTRNETIARNRKRYSDMLESNLVAHYGTGIEKLSGSYSDRFSKACDLVNRLLEQ